MAQGQTQNVSPAGGQQVIPNNSQTTTRQQNARLRKQIKQANHLFTWLGGFIFGLLPLMWCKFEKFTYFDQQTIVDSLTTYQEEFMRSGSFLWASISLLVMSYIELLLYGFNRKVSEKSKFVYKVILVAMLIVLVLALDVYFRNITTPIHKDRMVLYSWIAFISFSAVSAYISFKLVKEV